ncbi:hypothetical protein FQN54_009718 [Arachnomyces sp. PD_36]|nr:hypothetical protein FQN54_009718 [Arachnomyces sp. PD_36]
MPYYQYGNTEPHRRTGVVEPDPDNEPTVYQYIPATPSTNSTTYSAPAAPAAGTSNPPNPVVYVGVPPLVFTPMLGQQVSYFAAPGSGTPLPFNPSQYQPSAPFHVYQPSPPTAPGVVNWQGATRAEVEARNPPKPPQLIPYNATPGQQWWCKETDGSFSLRGTNDIMENCQPGRWVYASGTTNPYFIREARS